MLRKKREKERERYYLLPGQGGKAYRRKQKVFLTWAIIVGILASAIFCVVLYLVNRALPPSDQ